MYFRHCAGTFTATHTIKHTYITLYEAFIIPILQIKKLGLRKI